MSIGAFASTHGTRRTLRRRAPVWTKNSDLILTRRSAVLRSPCRTFHVAQERARCAAALADRFEILSIVVGRLNRHRTRSDASTVLHDGISHTPRYARGNPNVISTTEGRPKFGSKVNQGRPAPLESTNRRPWLLSIEYRECRCLHIIRVGYHVIDCECSAVFGDCAADLAYWLASSFQCEFDGVGIDPHP